MKSTKTSLAAICALLALSCGGVGCSTSARLKTADYERLPASDSSPADVSVYSTYNIGRPYRSVGIVVSNADAGGDAHDAVSELKSQAAQLGANAIVGLTLEISMGFWESAVRATGVAVRY